MAPTSRPRSLTKASFPAFFKAQKISSYPDSIPRGTSAPPIRTIAWNPLGTLVATGGDRTLRIWNPERTNAKSVTELRGHSLTVERVAFNPTKEGELASCAADGTVRFWDVRSKSSVGEVKVGGEVFTLAWKPDGSEILAGRKDDTLIPISRSTLSAMPSMRQNVQTNQTIFSWSGEELLLTTGDGQVKILDYPSMAPLHTLNAHTSACSTIDYSPNGDYIAIGGSDALITLWDTTDWICQRSLTAITGPVRSVGFSFDGSYVVGGSDEGTGLEIAHTATGEYVHKIETNYPSPAVAWHPSRYVLAYGQHTPYGTTGEGLKIVGGVSGGL